MTAIRPPFLCTRADKAACPHSWARLGPSAMENQHPTPAMERAPKVSFVSLGCPKALVDSERIITRLRAEGYELARSHAGADPAVVNPCGFLDSPHPQPLSPTAPPLPTTPPPTVTTY